MTTLTPRVSVIIPVYNGERFLRAAIESVRSQTYRSWELILVDDGSTDGSLAIATEWTARAAERIRLLQHAGGQNRGTAATRNLGIAHSRGAFVANLDQDDAWSSTKLDEQVPILEREPGIGMTFAPMTLWSAWDESANDSRDRVQTLTFPTETLFSPPDFLPPLLSGKNDPHGYLARRDVLERVGGYVESVGICEDWALYAKVGLTSRIYVAGKSNYYYRQHPEQRCSLQREAGHLYSSFWSFYDWFGTYLAESGCGDPRVFRAFRAAVRRNRFLACSERACHPARRVRALLKAHLT